MDIRPIEQVGHDLFIKFAHNGYLPMLKSQGVVRQRLELIYEIDNGGLDEWAKERIERLLEKAANLKREHGHRFIPAPAVDDYAAHIEAALRIGSVHDADEILGA